jgi:SH3 domain-containing YSC84-like protein 1
MCVIRRRVSAESELHEMNPTNSRLSRKMLTLGLMLVFFISINLSWADDQSDIAKRLAASAKVLDEVMATPNKSIPKGVIERAQCVAVFPSTVQVAVLVGAKHGKGFATCRTARGWSAPAPLAVTGGSWGAQLGGQEVDLVLVVLNDQGMKQLVSGKMNLGTETSVTAGPIGNQEWKMNEDILTYARAKGAFAGVNLAGSSITEDQDDARALYGSPVSLADILAGRVQPTTGSQPFLETVAKYAGQTKSKD